MNIRTRAKTPVGILRHVARLILDEPKRFYQELFLVKGQPGQKSISNHRFPACGIIGCVAGWVVVATGREHSEASVCSMAASALGLDRFQTFELFRGVALDSCLSADGTKAYARAGVRHIAKFVKKHYGVELGVK